MKTKKLLFALMLMGLTGCWLGVDYYTMRPVYYFVNKSDKEVRLIYTLQPNMVNQGLKQRDTIEILANDTAIWAYREPLNIDKSCKPASMFNTIKFVTESGDIIQAYDRVNNSEWRVFPIRNEPDLAGYMNLKRMNK